MHVTEAICFTELPRLQAYWELWRTSAYIQFYERYLYSFNIQHSDSHILPAPGNLCERKDLHYILRYRGCKDYILSRTD